MNRIRQIRQLVGYLLEIYFGCLCGWAFLLYEYHWPRAILEDWIRLTWVIVAIIIGWRIWHFNDIRRKLIQNIPTQINDHSIFAQLYLQYIHDLQR